MDNINAIARDKFQRPNRRDTREHTTISKIANLRSSGKGFILFYFFFFWRKVVRGKVVR